MKGTIAVRMVADIIQAHPDCLLMDTDSLTDVVNSGAPVVVNKVRVGCGCGWQAIEYSHSTHVALLIVEALREEE